jgi:hypothetical protein
VRERNWRCWERGKKNLLVERLVFLESSSILAWIPGVPGLLCQSHGIGVRSHCYHPGSWNLMNCQSIATGQWDERTLEDCCCTHGVVGEVGTEERIHFVLMREGENRGNGYRLAVDRWVSQRNVRVEERI